MRAIIDICILLFFAKLMGIFFQKIGFPENIGFLFTGFLFARALKNIEKITGSQLKYMNVAKNLLQF